MTDDGSHRFTSRSMSLANLRDGLLEKRFSDRVSSLRRRSSRLRALNNVTTALTQHVGLPSAIGLDYHADPPPPLTHDEEHVLDEYSLEKGRRITDTSFQITLDALLALLPTTEAKDITAVDKDNVIQPDSPVHDADLHEPAALAVPTTSSSPLRPDSPETTISTEAKVESAQTPQRKPHTITCPPVEDHLPSAEQTSPRNTEDRAALETRQQPEDTVATIVNGHNSPKDDHAPSIDSQTTPQSTKGHDAIPAQDALSPRNAVDESASSYSPGEQLRREQEQALLALRRSATDVDMSDGPEPGRSTTSVEVVVAQEPSKEAPVDKPSNARTTDIESLTVENEIHAKSAIEQSTLPEHQAALASRQVPEPVPSTSILDVKASDARKRSSAPLSPPSGLGSGLSISKPKQSTITGAEDAVPKLPKDYEQGYVSLRAVAVDPARDYLEPLYRLQAQDPPNGKSLPELLYKATKTVNTADQTRSIRERLDQRVLKRIYALQSSDKWSLRHASAAEEPVPVKTHIDHLMAEMRWMRADFRAERKLKQSLAKYFAMQCAEWVLSDEPHQRSMQVTRSVVGSSTTPLDAERHSAATQGPHTPAATTTNDTLAVQTHIDKPPELDATSLTGSSPSDDTDMPLTPTNAYIPWSLVESAKLEEPLLEQPLQDKLFEALQKLPLKSPFDTHPYANYTHEIGRSALPSVSKFSDAKLLAQLCTPGRKRSRYDYLDDDEDLDLDSRKRAKVVLEPESTDLALFDPDNKVIRDRLHAQTAFRPPSDHPMPTTHFYEFRQSSQWTWDDDQKLKELAKDYSFNWGLISDEVSSPSAMHSAADRRTPWECFERWIELESMPYEMRKTVYFRSWNQRVEAAIRNVETRYQTQLQMHAQNGNQGPVPMRRRIQPMHVEKRRSSRHMHLVDAMRKLARKREQIQFKQAEAAKAASLRKQQEAAQPKPVTQTPQQFSRLRQENDQLLAARQEKYREQMATQQKAAQMQRSGQYASHQQAMAAIQQQKQRAAAAAAGQITQAHGGQQGASAHNMQNLHPGQQSQMVAQRNEHLAVPNMGATQNRPRSGMAGVQASGMYNGQEASQMQGRAKSAQHPGQHFQSQALQQQHLSPGGLPNVMGGQHPMVAAAMQASHSNGGQMMQRNLSNHSNTASSQGASASPHMRAPMMAGAQPAQLSSGLVPAIAQIKHSLQAAHPQATPMQIDQMAAEQMKRQFSQQRQNVIAAAASGQGMQNGQLAQNPAAYMHGGVQFQQNGHPNMGIASPQQAQAYAAIMRQRALQQQSQLQAGNTANGGPRVLTPQQQQQMQQQLLQQGTSNNSSSASAGQGSPIRNQKPAPQGQNQAQAQGQNQAPAAAGPVSLRMTPQQQAQAQQLLLQQRSQNSQARSETPQMARVSSASGSAKAGSPTGKAASMQPPPQTSTPAPKPTQPATQPVPQQAR